MNRTLFYTTALALVACSPSVPTPAPLPQVPSSLNFSSANLSGNAQVAKGQELSVELRNSGNSKVDYQLQFPSGADGLFLDVDPETAPGSIEAGKIQNFKVYFECPVTPGTYSDNVTVKYDGKTLSLPVTVQVVV